MQKSVISEKWLLHAGKLRVEAETLPLGRARDGLLRQARHLETRCTVKARATYPDQKSQRSDEELDALQTVPGKDIG